MLNLFQRKKNISSFRDKIFQIVFQNSEHRGKTGLEITSKVTLIADQDLRKLNAYKKGTQIIKGQGYREIEEVFSKILKDELDNQKFYKIYRIRFLTASEEVKDLDFNFEQDLKQWFRDLLDMFKDFSLPGEPNDLDLVLSGYKKECDSYRFSGGDKFDKDELRIAKRLVEMVTKLVGRYTFTKLLIGSIFVKDNNIIFISHIRGKFQKIIKNCGILFPVKIREEL